MSMGYMIPEQPDFKFRAWTTKSKKMYCHAYFDWTEVQIFNDEIGEYEIIGDRNENSLLQHVILMQFIGIKDKNNREIYEGDICRMVLAGGQSILGVIEYHAPWFWLSTVADGWDIDDYLEIEILGNVYENLEILEKHYE